MFRRVWFTEMQKVVKSAVWVPVAMIPLFAVILGLLGPHDEPGSTSSQMLWLALYQSAVLPYALLFFPLATCAIAALSCRMEHQSGGWKWIHALPVPRLAVYTAKFSIVWGVLGLLQLLLLCGILFDGLVFLHLPSQIPWGVLGRGILGGWLAAVPLAALQFWVASAWESFGAQFAISTILTLPGVAVIHSQTYGPLYPFVQPALAMLPNSSSTWLYVSTETSLTIVVSACILVIGSLWYFLRRDIA